MVDPNKLEASRKTLISRIRKKKKKEQGGQWLYSAAYRHLEMSTPNSYN